ncbi:hypothetical protein [Lacihabitans lacunae]|uniref:ABC transporter permease n=1 Tax=Lacihabitans lacunae TaxID=1028214 RepID=A0ABV7YPI0_9BACT
MRATRLVFFKCLVLEYYKQNALFLLGVFLLCFGFLKSSEHIAIIQSALSSYYLLGVVFVLWLFYALKVTLFVTQSLSLPYMSFLSLVKMLPKPQRFLLWAGVQFLNLQLTFLYAIFMVAVALPQGKVISVILILGVHLFFVIIGVLFFENKLKQKVSILDKLIPDFKLFKFPIPQFLFYFKYLFVRQTALVLISKIGGVLIVSFFCWLFPTDDYDWRLFGFCGVFLGVATYNFSQQWLFYQRQYLLFDRNMPVSLIKRYGRLVLTFLLILVPEVLALAVKLPETLSYLFIAEFLFFVISFSLAIHLMFYLFPDYDQEQSLKALFWFALAIVFLILFKMPLYFLSSVLILGSWFLYKKKYYNFE